MIYKSQASIFRMSSREPNKFERFYWEGGKDGDASYSKTLAVRLLWPALDLVKDKLATAVDKIPFSAEDVGAFMIADYGCRDGGASVPLIRHLIDHVRQKYKSTLDIQVMYEDLPTCDFKSLFILANGLTGAEYESAWSHQKGVYFSAVGRTFYEQCFPRNSVHVGFSTYAMVYLSTRPCLFPDVLIYSLSTDEKKKALVAKQAASDWETLLLHRCRELVPGGILFIIAFYTTEDGQHFGATAGGRNLFETMHTSWKQLYQEGKITKEELEEPTFNWYIRTVEEFKAPLLNKDSAVYREGLRLVSVETETTPGSLNKKLHERGASDPEFAAKMAHQFVASVRPSASGDFLAALSSRPETDRREIVDELFQGMEAQVRAEPTRHRQNIPVVRIMIQKTSMLWASL